MRNIDFSRIVDCSHVVSSAMPLWPGDPDTVFSPVASLEEQGYFLRSFSMGEHSGTHCNAPNCFFEGAEDVAEILREPPVMPMLVATMVHKAAKDADATWTVSNLEAWEAEHGRVSEGSLFCLHTGWSKLWGEPACFLGTDERGGMHFPAFSPEVAEVLVHERGVAGLGIDTHGVDSPLDESFAVNSLTLRAGKLVVECLANLDDLPPVGATAAIGGLKLVGGAGSPVAVTVFVP